MREYKIEAFVDGERIASVEGPLYDDAYALFAGWQSLRLSLLRWALIHDH